MNQGDGRTKGNNNKTQGNGENRYCRLAISLDLKMKLYQWC